MTNLERLKIELANKEYYGDDVYNLYLQENELQPLDAYQKDTMQYNLLATIVDILESLANDLNLYRQVETEFSTTSEAYTHLEKRIANIKKRMMAIEDVANSTGVFSMLFKRG
jgi:hypothetical protein